MIRRLLFLSLCSACICGAADYGDALTGAFRWYYRWMKPLPVERVIQCTVASFSGAAFAYCQPGELTIDFLPTIHNPHRTGDILHASGGFNEEVKDFERHRLNDETQRYVVTRIAIPTDTLSGCEPDASFTARVVSSAVNKKIRDDLKLLGISLRFPLACKGEPFSLVYFMKGSTIEWIWQVDRNAEAVWSYDKGNEQRKIPKVAIENLHRPELWYRPAGR